MPLPEPTNQRRRAFLDFGGCGCCLLVVLNLPFLFVPVLIFGVAKQLSDENKARKHKSKEHPPIADPNPPIQDDATP